MIGLLIVLPIVFYWFLVETDYLRIRLAICTCSPNLAAISAAPILDYTPAPDKPQILTSYCNKCRQTTHVIPIRTIQAFGHTLELNAGCNRCRAKALREMAKVQRTKVKVEYKQSVRELNMPIDPRFACAKPLLVSDEWLESHRHNLDDYEPTIELAIDDKRISFNGDYKKGCIKDFVKANKG